MSAAVWRAIGLVVLFVIWSAILLPEASASLADLEIESVQTQPPRLTAGTAIAAVAVIRNNGAEPAENFSIQVTVRQKGKEVLVIEEIPVTARLPRLGSGLSVPVDLGKLAEGSYELVVVVDPVDRIRETNERNNEVRMPLQVWPPAFVSETYPR